MQDDYCAAHSIAMVSPLHSPLQNIRWNEKNNMLVVMLSTHPLPTCILVLYFTPFESPLMATATIEKKPKLLAGRGRDCQKSCEEGLRNDDGSPPRPRPRHRN